MNAGADIISSFSAPNIILPASGQKTEEKTDASETIASIINSTRMKTAPPVMRSFSRDISKVTERKKNMKSAALLRESMEKKDDEKKEREEKKEVPAPEKKFNDFVVIPQKKEEPAVVSESPKKESADLNKKGRPRIPSAPPPLYQKKQDSDIPIKISSEKPAVMGESGGKKMNGSGFFKSLSKVHDSDSVGKMASPEKKDQQRVDFAKSKPTVPIVLPVSQKPAFENKKKTEVLQKPAVPVPIKKTPPPSLLITPQLVQKSEPIAPLPVSPVQELKKSNVPKDAQAQKAIDDLLVEMGGSVAPLPAEPKKPDAPKSEPKKEEPKKPAPVPSIATPVIPSPVPEPKFEPNIEPKPIIPEMIKPTPVPVSEPKPIPVPEPKSESKPQPTDEEAAILADVIFAPPTHAAAEKEMPKEVQQEIAQPLPQQPAVQIVEPSKEHVPMKEGELSEAVAPVSTPRPRPSYHISVEELSILKNDIVRIEEEMKVSEIQQQSIAARKQRTLTEKSDLEGKIRDIKPRLDTIIKREEEFVQRIVALEREEMGITDKNQRHQIEEKRWKEEDARADVAKERWNMEDSQAKLVVLAKEKQDELTRVTESQNELLRRMELLTRERNEKKLKVRLGEIEEKKRELEDIQLALLEEKRRLDHFLVACEEKEKDLLGKRQITEDEEKHITDPAGRRTFEEARRAMEKQQREVEQRRWEAEKTLEKVQEKIVKSNEHHATISRIEDEVRQKLN